MIGKRLVFGPITWLPINDKIIKININHLSVAVQDHAAATSENEPSELEAISDDQSSNVIQVMDKAGVPLYKPHEQLYVDIKEMEPAQVLFMTSKIYNSDL